MLLFILVNIAQLALNARRGNISGSRSSASASKIVERIETNVDLRHEVSSQDHADVSPQVVSERNSAVGITRCRLATMPKGDIVHA